MRILWIPHTAWHIPQRAHLFCRALSTHHEIHVTDWVADFTRINDYLSWRYVRNFTPRHYRDGQIHVHGIPRISPALFISSIRHINQRIFSWYVQRIIKQHQIDVVVSTFVVPPPQAKRVIFDLFDENVAPWRQSRLGTTYAAEIAQIEDRYLSTADATVAASTVLFDKAQHLVRDRPVYLIPNGIDLSAYRNADGSEFRNQIQPSGKLIGTVGSYDTHGEMELLIDTAMLMTNEPVTFLIGGRGSCLAWARKEVQKRNLTNVLIHGFVPFDQLASVVAAFDVGLCPYRKSKMDNARSPMRLFSYLATGTPAVCTDLTSVRELAMENVVLVDDTPQDFAEGIRQALALPRRQPKGLYKHDLSRLVHQYEQVLKGNKVGERLYGGV